MMQKRRPAKVLIIDDEDPVLRMLSTALSRRGFLPDTARTGKEGIEKIKINSYDVVLTDIRMPEMSGEEVAFELRVIKGHAIPVVGMSGTPWLLDKNLFDAVLEKPCLIKDLFEIIYKILPGFGS